MEMIVPYMRQYVSYSPNKFQVSYIPTTKCQLRTVNKCQVSYLEMLGTYPIAGIHETVGY